MRITYRRTGGGLVVLAVVLVATGLAAAVAVVLGLVVAAIGTVVLLVRAVLPSSRRGQTTPPATPWPLETFDATVVNPSGSSNERLLHSDSDKG
jgi:hypothetical protein